MTQKRLNLIIPAVLLAADAYYLYIAFTAREYKSTTVGPYEFPKIIGIILAILCVVLIVQTLLARGPDEKIEIKNIGAALITMAATFLFLFLWKTIGHVYILGFFFLLLLMFVYRKEDRFVLKNIIINVAVAGGTALLAYVLYAVVMNIRM